MADVTTATNCSDNGGLTTVFLTDDASIDWTAMALVGNYTDATHTITNWVMISGGTWSEFQFERINGRLDSTYTRENGYYDILLQNLIFKGKSAARSITLGKLKSCCGLIAQVHDNNSLARVFGREYISGAWVLPLVSGSVGRHLDTTGAFGNLEDRSRDEIDLTGRHINPMPFSTVTIATMKTL